MSILSFWSIFIVSLEVNHEVHLNLRRAFQYRTSYLEKHIETFMYHIF